MPGGALAPASRPTMPNAHCRYQFLSLAYLIVYGVYPERYGGTGTPSIVAEREWQSWDTFYTVRAPVLTPTPACVTNCWTQRLA